MLRVALAVLAMMLAAQPSAAQGSHRLPGPSSSQLFVARPPSPTRITPDTTPKVIRPTHWKRGLLIGGTIGAATLGALGYALCHDLSETRTSCLGPAVGGAAVGAVMGGITGALIGGAFRKRGPADSTAAGP
jgi:hypothetical protein